MTVGNIVLTSLKNSEQIPTMDLSLLFGNLHNHEEMNILSKEIMQDTHTNRYVALYSKNLVLNCDIDFSNESKGGSLIIKCYISQSDKKPFGSRRFSLKVDSSASKGYDTGRKFVVEKRKDPSASIVEVLIILPGSESIRMWIQMKIMRRSIRSCWPL